MRRTRIALGLDLVRRFGLYIMDTIITLALGAESFVLQKRKCMVAKRGAMWVNSATGVANGVNLHVKVAL